MRFTMTVEFGNEAMESFADMELATRLIFKDFSRREEAPEDGDEGRIYDINGNKVGHWEFAE